MISRRKFLANSIETLISGLVVLNSPGCKEKSSLKHQQRVQMIEDLRRDAQIYVSYVYREGYVYDVKVGEKKEKKVHVNLSHVRFEKEGNLLKYTMGDTTVRVYEKGNIKVWEKNTRVTDSGKIALIQKETDEVLKAVADANKELFESRIRKTGLPVFDYRTPSKSKLFNY